jgi:hypothetical protein
MRYRKLSPLGDYTFGQGMLNFYIDVPAAVAQAVETGLLLWLGEWFLDTTVGMPWIEGVLGKNSQATGDATIQNQIIGTQGVTAISSYQSTRGNDVERNFNVEVGIETIYGPTTVQLDEEDLF